MTTTVKYIVIRDSTNNIVKKQLGEAFPAGQLRSYGNWFMTSYYCYSFNFGGSEWYFGFNMLPGLLCTHTNEGSVKLPVSLPGGAEVGKYDTIGRFTNMLSNWPLAMTMDVPPRTTIYDANAQQYTISYETETLYHYFYYVKFPSNSAKSFSIITPSSDKVSGKGTSSNPWTWSSTENSQKIEIRVRLTDNVKEYISSSTDSRGFSVSSVDKTVSNVKYKYFTVSGFTYAADTVGCLSVDIKQAYTQNVHFTVMYCNGLEVMRPNWGLDNITSANVVSNGQTVGKKYTITTEGVKGSKVYNFTFCAISGSTDRLTGRIFYVESMPNGATFSSSKKDADWQNIKINFQPTCSNVDNNYTISFGEYIYIGIGSTLPTGVKSVALSFTGSTSHSNDFFSPIIGTKNFRLYKEAFYTITAKSDKNGGYYFDNLHGVDGSCPLLQTDSYTTSSRKLDGRGGIIPISVVHYGISVKFSNNSFTSYGSLSIAYGNTWTTNLNTISGNTVKVKYTPKNNQDSINPYAFMLSSVAIEGTATTIPPPSNYVNYNNAAEVSYAIGNTANNIVFVATLTQRRWKVHLNDTQRNSRGNSSIVALINNIVDPKMKFGDDVYISTNENIRIDVVPKEHYRLSSITPSNGLVAVAGQTGIATKYKLQKFGNNYIDASVSVLYDRNDHYIVTTSNDSKIQTVRVNNASVNYGYYKKSEYNSVNGRPIVVITTFSGENVGKYKVSSFKLYRYDYNKTDNKGELLYTFSESANEIDKDLTSSSAHVYFTSFYPNAYGVDDFLVESIATSLYDNVKVEVKNGTFTMVNGVEKFTSSTKNFGYIQTRIGDATDTRSDNFTQSIKDGTVITINCGNYYGGILSRIVVKDAEGTHTHNNNPFAYVKLHGEATITVYFCERETFNLLVNAYLGGDSTGFKVGNVVVTSTNPTTDFSVETDTYMITVPLYVGEEYVCTVKPPQDEYFNRRYYFRWWNVNRNGYFDDPTSITENITSDTFVIYEPTKPSKPIRLGANYGKRETASVIVSYAIRSVNSQGLEVITPT